MLDFKAKTAVITGAASGIGFAIARRLATAGANVVLADIDPVALERATAAIEKLGVAAIGVPTDVSEPAAVDALAAAAVARFERVHVLVNNAGVAMKGYSWELAPADWQWVMGVCLWGVVHGIRSFVPAMIAHGETGHIINTSSMTGLGASAQGGPYQAAKSGVVAVTETLSFELEVVAPHLGVTLLCPVTLTRTSNRRVSTAPSVSADLPQCRTPAPSPNRRARHVCHPT